MLMPRRFDELRAEQALLAQRLVIADDFAPIRTIAGADLAIDPATHTGFAGVIVYRYPELQEFTRVWAQAPLTLPYIPGLLSYREGPVLQQAFAQLDELPDVILFDGQGIAHPRGVGLASHMGLLLDRPTIGCAKSRLVGDFEPPAPTAGSQSPLQYHDRMVGAVLRTRDGVQPLFISPGHRISTATAVHIVAQCGDGRRLPKPTREADRWVAELKRRCTSGTVTGNPLDENPEGT